MGITSLLPIFMGKVITDQLQIWTKETIAALVDGIILPLDFHSFMDISH